MKPIANVSAGSWMLRPGRWFGLFALASAVACSPPAPVSKTLPAAEEHLKAVNEARANLRTVRAEARAEYRKGGRRFKFHASILAAHPDRLFLEAGGFGFSATQLLAEGDSVRVFTPARNLDLSGDAKTALAHLFGVRLSTKEWIGFLLGQIPYPPDRIESFSRRGDRWTLRAHYGPDLLRLSGEERTGWVTSIENDRDKREGIYFGSPITTPAGAYPSTIRVTGARGSLELRFDRVDPNLTITDRSFTLDVPPGVPKRSLENSDLVIGQ
jgi:hypothetical protein